MKKAIIGNGGHSKEVIAHLSDDVCFFVSDEFYDVNETNCLPLSKFDPDIYEVMICVGNSSLREKIFKQLPIKTKFFSFIHPTALILDENNKIGEGSFIGPYCILTTNIKIGPHSILLRNVSIGHDCRIGDYFSAMPGTVISGSSNIGNRNYFGNNSSNKEKLNITDDVTIGMNSCVTKNIDDSGVYVGVPAKKIK